MTFLIVSAVCLMGESGLVESTAVVNGFGTS